MFRVALIAVLGGAGLMVTPAPAVAQFNGGFGSPYGGAGPILPYQFRVTTWSLPLPGLAGGPTQIGFTRAYYGTGFTNPWLSYAYNPWPDYRQSGYQSMSGYITGGVGARNLAAENFQKNVAKAQNQAALTADTGAKNQIFDQWAYEKLGVMGLPALQPGKDVPEALLKALTGANENELVSGEALNHIEIGIVAAEGKGGKAPSAFLPPDLLAEIRFAGSPAADALNLLRQTGRLDFPAAFDADALKPSRAALEADFAAATAPVLVGRTPDTAKLAKLEATVKAAQEALTPAIRDLPFEDATAAKKFLNDMAATIPVLRDPKSAGLVNPKWATEGTNVADLVKHMARHKLLFGPAPKGGEEAYMALHQALAAYLIAISPQKK